MDATQSNLAVQEFVELVTTPSVSGNERQIADLLLRKLRELDCLDIHEDEAGIALGGNTGNIYGVLPGELPGAILFCAHMDRGEILSAREIRPEIREGRIYSDGTTLLAADDVAGIVAILGGLRRLKRSGKPHCSVEVLFTVCEEDCAQGSLHAEYNRLNAKIGYAMDSNGNIGRIVNRMPSGAKLSVEIFGRGAHYGSAPENGVDAAQIAARILTNIRQGRIDQETVANFPVLHAGGNATYGICEYAVIKGQAQSHNHDKLLDYIRYFEAFCRQEKANTGVSVKSDSQILYRGCGIDVDSPCIRLATRALASLGVQVHADTGNACLDSHNFNAHGIQSVGLAMGYRLNHSTHEYQDIGQMLKNSELVERIVLEFSQAPEAYEVID